MESSLNTINASECSFSPSSYSHSLTLSHTPAMIFTLFYISLELNKGVTNKNVQRSRQCNLWKIALVNSIACVAFAS